METLRQAERELEGSDAEAVLLGADSLEMLKRTHSRYFGAGRDLIARIAANGGPPD